LSKDGNGRRAAPVGPTESWMKRLCVMPRLPLATAALRMGGVLAAALVWSLAAAGEGMRCASCGGEIRGRYLHGENGNYCSQACFDKTLPACAACGRRCGGQHLVMKGVDYCSRACLETRLPHCELCGKALEKSIVIGTHTFCEPHAAGPKCWKCQLPFARGSKLKDGRHVCAACDRGALYNLADARPHLDQARHEVWRITGFRSPTVPELALVGLDDFTRISRSTPAAGMMQRGLYRRETETTTERNVFGRVRHRHEEVTETLYILYGLAPHEFVATAAHELTHDLLAEKYPRLGENTPAWVQEGICQYVSAAVCLLNGYYDELKAIEDSPDPDYGGGYRFFKNKFSDGRWSSLARWLDTADLAALPARPPPLP